MSDPVWAELMDLLQSGYVNSFEETLVFLNLSRETVKNPVMGRDTQRPKDIAKDDDAMCTIAQCLKESEDAIRKGAFDDSYSARMRLAHYFQMKPGYRWLAEHIYYKSDDERMDVASVGGAKLKMRTFQLLGLLEETRSNIKVSMEYLEKGISISKKVGLECDDPDTRELLGHLCRLYRAMGSLLLERSKKSSIHFFRKAALIADRSDSRSDQAMCYGLLGKAMVQFGRKKRAIVFLEIFKALSEEEGDLEEVCHALYALSAIQREEQETQAKGEVALNRCLELALEGNFALPAIFSSITLGQLDTERRQYSSAAVHLERAYHILLASPPGDIEAEVGHLVRVMAGVGRAHLSLHALAQTFDRPPELCLPLILKWRNTGGVFDIEELEKEKFVPVDMDAKESQEGVASLIERLMAEELSG